MVHTVHDTSSIMFWFWKCDFESHSKRPRKHCKQQKTKHCKQQKTKKKTLSQLIIFQNINAHYPQFHYYSETYKGRKLLNLTCGHASDTSSCVELYGTHCVWNFYFALSYSILTFPWPLIYIIHTHISLYMHTHTHTQTGIPQRLFQIWFQTTVIK